MQIRYSPDADVLVIRLRTGTLHDSSDLCEGVIVHYDRRRSPLEIEILDASRVIDLDGVDVSLKELIPHKVATAS